MIVNLDSVPCSGDWRSGLSRPRKNVARTGRGNARYHSAAAAAKSGGSRLAARAGAGAGPNDLRNHKA
jgi:hypothetical protein